MGVPIDVPGLNQFIREIPDGSIISIEGGVDHPKAILAKTIMSAALVEGKKLVYIAQTSNCGLMDQLPNWREVRQKCFSDVDGRNVQLWADHIDSDTVVLIDSLSSLMLNRTVNEYLEVLESMRTAARRTGGIIILLVENDLLPTDMLIMAGYHSDGILQFLARDSPDGVSRFIRIYKWMSGESYDRNIYYNYVEGKINIDLRYRVV